MRFHSLILILIITFLLSCSAPLYYEKAKINEGFSFGTGIGIANGLYPNYSDMMGEDHLAILETAYLRYGFSDKFLLFLQTSFGYSARFSNINNWLKWDKNFVFWDAEIGVKIYTMNNHTIRLSTGVPNLLNATYLWDCKDWLTLHSGLQWKGPEITTSIGTIYHLTMHNRINSHIALNLSRSIYYSTSNIYAPPPIYISLGISIELAPIK